MDIIKTPSFLNLQLSPSIKTSHQSPPHNRPFPTISTVLEETTPFRAPCGWTCCARGAAPAVGDDLTTAAAGAGGGHKEFEWQPLRPSFLWQRGIATDNPRIACRFGYFMLFCLVRCWPKSNTEQNRLDINGYHQQE